MITNLHPINHYLKCQFLLVQLNILIRLYIQYHFLIHLLMRAFLTFKSISFVTFDDCDSITFELINSFFIFVDKIECATEKYMLLISILFFNNDNFALSIPMTSSLPESSNLSTPSAPLILYSNTLYLFNPISYTPTNFSPPVSFKIASKLLEISFSLALAIKLMLDDKLSEKLAFTI